MSGKGNLTKYQNTEIGMFPKDWRLIEVGQLNPFITSGSRGWAQFYSEYGSPFIRITNMSRESISLDQTELRYVELPDYASEGKRTQLKNGDLLVSITADIGIISYVDEALQKPAYINQHIALIRFENSQINSLYLSYFLAYENAQTWFRGGTDQGAKAGMSLITVRKIKAVLPSPKEQDAIAESLSDTDALIESLEKLIAKKRLIKQGAMQELLTGKRRLPDFGSKKDVRKTEIGLIPEDWGIEKIKALALISTGSRNTQDRVHNGKYPFFVRSQTIERINSYSFDGEAVLTAGDGVGTGKIFHYIQGKFDIHQRVYKISNFKPELDGFFFYTYFSNHFYDRIMSMTAKSSVDSVRMEMIADMLIPLPQTEEQKAIATILSDMDTEISTLEEKLAKIKQVKQGMMNELLTGRIRLI